MVVIYNFLIFKFSNYESRFDDCYLDYCMYSSPNLYYLQDFKTFKKTKT